MGGHIGGECEEELLDVTPKSMWLDLITAGRESGRGSEPTKWAKQGTAVLAVPYYNLSREWAPKSLFESLRPLYCG